MKEGVKQVLYVLNILKKSDVPCNLTLYYKDEKFNQVGRGVHITLDKIPMDTINGDNNFLIKVRLGYSCFPFTNYESSLNEYEMLYFEHTLIHKFPEHIKNWKRKDTLDYILSDPNPSTEVPV